jgi:hypothetical protein
MRPDRPGKAFARGRRLAKRFPDVQQADAVSTAIGAARKKQKSHRIRRLSSRFTRLKGRAG